MRTDAGERGDARRDGAGIEWMPNGCAEDSAIPANTRIETLALTRVRDNLCKFKREWGRYGKQPLGDV